MKLVFLGTPEFAVPTLDKLPRYGHDLRLVVTQPDRPSGRGQKFHASPVKERALKLKLPVYQPEDVNSEESLKKIASCGPDVIVVVAFGQYLKKKLRAIPHLGCLNLHPSLLPKLRGAAPIQRAVMEGYNLSGVSTFRIEKEMDAGSIYLAAPMPIGEMTTAGELHDLLKMFGAELVCATLDRFTKGERKLTPQNNDEATYAPKIGPNEQEIDWTQDAEVIDRKIRGLSPLPGAFTHFRGKRILLLRSSIGGFEVDDVLPGAIVNVRSNYVEVKTGNGTVALYELKPEGKGAMSSGEWSKGMRINKMECFENEKAD
ncbi:MAG: methionyl-tRNA formyltransferase [Nitrospinota bacterium]